MSDTMKQAQKAIEAAADAFNFYVEQHLLKSPPDTKKAEANRVLAQQMNDAIGAILREITAPKPVRRFRIVQRGPNWASFTIYEKTDRSEKRLCTDVVDRETALEIIAALGGVVEERT